MILLSETTLVSSFVVENQKPKTEIEIECPVLFLWRCSSNLLLFEDTETSSSTNIRVDGI